MLVYGESFQPALNSSHTFLSSHYRPHHLFQAILFYHAKKILLLYLKNSDLIFTDSPSHYLNLHIYFTFLLMLSSLSICYLHCLFLQCCGSGFYYDYFEFFLGLRGICSKLISFKNDRNKRERGVVRTSDRFPVLTPCVILIRVIHFTWL